MYILRNSEAADRDGGGIPAQSANQDDPTTKPSVQSHRAHRNPNATRSKVPCGKKSEVESIIRTMFIPGGVEVSSQHGTVVYEVSDTVVEEYQLMTRLGTSP